MSDDERDVESDAVSVHAVSAEMTGLTCRISGHTTTRWKGNAATT